MIVAVEGVSAAGKTTWCDRHPGRIVPELAPLNPPSEEPLALADFWTHANCCRWADAERIEASEGIAYCDTDPLKLHYTWCVWRAGRSSFVGCASAHHRRGTPLPSGGRRKVYPIEDLNRLLEEFGRFAVPPALVSMAF